MTTRNTLAASSGAAPEPPSPGLLMARHALHRVVEIIVALAFVAVAVAIGAYLMKTRPHATRLTSAARAFPVETMTVAHVDFPVTLQAMGYVMPVSTVDLTPEVSGRVTALGEGLRMGAVIPAGATAVQLDGADYVLKVEQLEAQLAQLDATIAQRAADLAQRRNDLTRSVMAVKQRQNDLVQRQQSLASAREALRLEQAQQELAAAELKSYGKAMSDTDRAIMLREPQLRQAEQGVASAQAAVASASTAIEAEQATGDSTQAAIDSAAAALEGAEASKRATATSLAQARLDLARTRVVAPFDALVRERPVAVGMQVSAATSVATLVDVSRYWVRVRIPSSDLKWLVFPTATSPGSSVQLRDVHAWGPDESREGEVIDLLGSVEADGQMAQILVAVDDPLARRPEHAGKPRLLLGAYVEASITGHSIPDAVALPRSALREGGELWLMSAENTLEIRQVAPVWSTTDAIVLAAGVADGERVVTSDLATPRAGMALVDAPKAVLASAVAPSPAASSSPASAPPLSATTASPAAHAAATPATKELRHE